jgi:hypothetical protein
MSRPPASRLDASQVLRHAFDDESGTLRVNSEATVVVGSVEVALDHQTDSIKIGDGIRTVDVAEDNSLKVTGGLIKEPFDYFTGSHTSTTSTYVFRNGGVSGELVATVNITYVDGTKREILSFEVIK